MRQRCGLEFTKLMLNSDMKFNVLKTT